MRARPGPAATLAAIALIAACDDPSLQISFRVPETYRGLVETVRLRILVPPVGGKFTCDQLAFREVAEDTVELSTVQVVIVRGDGAAADLSGIPRVDDKLILVEGLDAAELPLIAACRELGEVVDDESIDLEGEPTAALTLPTNDLGEPIVGPVVALVTDQRGRPLAGVDIKWFTTGPANETHEGSVVTGSTGRAQVDPVVSARFGPVALDVRARWESGTPQTIRGFNQPPKIFAGELPVNDNVQLIQTEAMYQVGRVGPEGQRGFGVLLVGDGVVGGREVQVSYYDPGGGAAFRSATSSPIGGAAALGLVTRGGGDHLITITPTTWVEIEPDGSVVTSPTPTDLGVATRIVPVGGCGENAGNERVLAQFGSGFATLTADRQQVAGPFDGVSSSLRIVGSGCVQGINDNAFRAVAYNDDQFRQTVVAEMAGVRSAPFPGLRSGLGFARATREDGARLLGTTIDIDGTAVTRYRLQSLGADSLDLEADSQDPTPALPISSAGGDIDGDGYADVVSIVAFGEVQGRVQYRILTALGVPHNGGRLVGLSPATESVQPRLWIFDFDRDGIDDILVGGPDGFGVYRMGE